MGAREEARDLANKNKQQQNKQGVNRAPGALGGAGESTGGLCLFTLCGIIATTTATAWGVWRWTR